MISTETKLGVALQRLVRRLRCARARLAYHSRPGHGASHTRLPAGEAKALARADVSRLEYLIEIHKSSNDQAHRSAPGGEVERNQEKQNE